MSGPADKVIALLRQQVLAAGTQSGTGQMEDGSVDLWIVLQGSEDELIGYAPLPPAVAWEWKAGKLTAAFRTVQVRAREKGILDQAWLLAARDLRYEVVSPLTLTVRSHWVRPGDTVHLHDIRMHLIMDMVSL